MNTIAVGTLIKGGQALYTIQSVKALYLRGEEALCEWMVREGLLYLDEYRMDGRKVGNIVTGRILQ